MRGWDTVRLAFVFVLLLVLHFTIRPLLGWRVEPDFLIIGVLLVAIRVRPGTAALVGFVTGLMVDSLALEHFGAVALATSIVAFSASWLKAVFFADDVVLNAFFFFLGKWALDILLVLIAHRALGGDAVMQVLVWSPLAAMMTALAGLAAIVILRPVLSRSVT
ncbi:MAG TPA: rod shape-determining protein MreD [Gemmatimonadaceae bacterium]|nr:rod shape-determining protein MreD [Gemmatimonadaceae bacterium]